MLRLSFWPDVWDFLNDAIPLCMQVTYWRFLSFQVLECSIIDRNETVSACLGFLTVKLTLVHWYIRTCNYCYWEPPVKTLWTRVVPMNMSLIWILLGLRQPNYPYLPSDLSHMGSNQRLDLWLVCCTHATYAFGKMMDSSKFAFENWWLKQIMLSKFGGLKQIMLSNMNGLKQTMLSKIDGLK